MTLKAPRAFAAVALFWRGRKVKVDFVTADWLYRHPGLDCADRSQGEQVYGDMVDGFAG